MGGATSQRGTAPINCPHPEWVMFGRVTKTARIYRPNGHRMGELIRSRSGIVVPAASGGGAAR
jgi:hypothetical protein